MRTYIRRLKNCGLRTGYISAKLFKAAVPKKIFVCIWPTDPNIKERAYFFIRQNSAKRYELVLKINEKYEKQKYILKFDKTANVFDNDGFFWTAAKGHNFRIETEEVNDNEIVFYGSYKNKSRYFLDMLEVIGKSVQKNISLCDYLQENFAIEEKNTYGFAIYFQVKFWPDTIAFGASLEKVYRFKPLSPLLGDINISGLLYEYVKDSAQPHKKAATTVDPEILEKTQEAAPFVSEACHDVRNVLKNCISNFIKNKAHQNLTDEDYLFLVEDILDNLSSVHHET